MNRLIEIMDNTHNTEVTAISVDCIKKVYRDKKEIYILFKDPDDEEIMCFVESYKTEYNAKLRLMHILNAVGTCMNIHGAYLCNGDEQNAEQTD